ncbi:VOC family protein [Crocosphaera sp. Alani8]|uniref:VOC family protein n=1 Tax=Crocosphaera sp. Alani8 TaxID=3038952 RepID=UPI00313E5088
MIEINRLLTNICSKNLAESKSFYTSLFDFRIDYDSDWFVHLVSEGRELELGLICESHEVVPGEVKGKPSGVYLTFVVKDVDELSKKTVELGYQIIQSPEITFYGQKRMLIVALEGTVCDVSSPS